jgi:hypothetical protein
MKLSITIALSALTGLGMLGTAALAPVASADNSTATAPMGSGHHIEARAWKDPGNNNPHFATSAWTYNGSALWNVTWIKDTADLYSTGGGITVTCSTDGKCGATGSVSPNHVSMYWQNGNTDESEVGGQILTSWNTLTTKVCSTGSAYSQALGLHGQVTTCAGWG